MRKIFILMLCIFLGCANAVQIEYKVKGCLVANVEATVNVNGIEFQNVANGNGDCRTNNTDASLLIPFQAGDKSNLSVTMNFGLKKDGVYLTDLSVEYDTTANVNVVLASKENKRLSNSNEYYLCDEPTTFNIKDNGKEANITFKYLKVQAFGVTNSTYSAKGSVCAKNQSTTAKPTTTHKVPTTTQKVPTTTNKVPTTTNKVPTTTNKVPTTTHKVPTTTHKVPTTTHKVPTTTHKVPTTTHKVPTTTHKVPTTTNKVPTTTHKVPTTTHKVTTTHSPVTTMKPTPAGKQVNGSVTDPKTKVVCVLVQFTGNLTVPYTTTKGENKTYHYGIQSVSSVNGICGNESQSIEFTLKNKWVLGMTFSKTSSKKVSRRLLADDGTYYMSQVKLTYDEAVIPGAKGGKKVDSKDSKDLNKASVGESYKCTSGEDIKMKSGVEFSAKDVEVEAFRSAKTKEFSGNAEVCSGDLSPGSNIVPIVVGVVLALLVVVIIIAYLIGRRRTQAGYQSV